MGGATRWVAGGVPAYNTGPYLGLAVRSLLAQSLPDGYAWSRIVVVVSGCTDDTEAVAEALTREEPRVVVVRQARREGKASALREIFARATGELLVLLNGDAVAAPGAVVALLAAGVGTPRPYAVMARPVVPAGPPTAWRRGIAALWELHDQVHEWAIGCGAGNHLSDELWLLPLPVDPELPEGVVNDGAQIGGWLRSHGGRLVYARDARVEIATPRTPTELLRQRRRIAYGDREIAARLGAAPTNFFWLLRAAPGVAVRCAVATVRTDPTAVPSLLLLTAIEAQANLLAAWDRYVTHRDHILWESVPPALPPTAGAPSPGKPGGSSVLRAEPAETEPHAPTTGSRRPVETERYSRRDRWVF